MINQELLCDPYIKKRLFRYVRISLTIIAVLLIAIPPSHADDKTLQFPADSLRISDVVRETILHNDRVAAARYMEKASYAKIGPAGAWNDPMLMAGVTNLPTSFDFKMDPMTMKMIGISQNIPYAGQKGLAAKAARAAAEASSEERRGVEVDLVTAAKYAYFDMYYRLAILKYIEDQHRLQEEIVASVAAKLRTDQANQADLAAAEADLWRLESDVLSAQQEVQAAQNTLNSLMGREPDTGIPSLVEPTFQSLPGSVDAWLDAARQYYPPLKRLKRQGESYAFSAASARRMRWPMLDLSANYGIRESTEMEKRDNMVGFQVTLSLPIFSGRQQGKMALSMESMRRSAELEASQTWRDIKANLQTLYAKARRLSQSLQLYRERIIPADQDAYRSAFTGYSANRIPFISLLTYAVNIYRDRITANQIAYELSRTLADAEQYTSNPEAWNEK